MQMTHSARVSSCAKSGRVAYLASEQISSGGRYLNLATKPFNSEYYARTPNGFVLINGEQIVKIETAKNGDNWDVVFYLSGGTSHTVSANAWTKKFVPELLEQLTLDKV